MAEVPMRFGSVCSGIEAASVAWHPLGWQAAWLAEIEPFPATVLKHHYPTVPNLGDMTTLPDRIASGEVEAPDLFCGGTPCQAFSVAGLRKSLDDTRGNLSLTFCEIANAIDARREQPAIVFWENVPGVLSTKDNAFGCFLAGLAGEDEALVPPGGRWTNAGFVDGPKRTVAWRVLDAQYFGVAQRRRRVFVVASARDGFDPAAVLFEFDGVRRDSAPSREARETVAPTIAGCANGGGANGPGRDVDSVESLQVCQPYTVANCLTARRHKGINSTLDEGQTPVVQPVAFTQNSRSEVRMIGGDGGVVGALAAETGTQQQNYVAQPVAFHPTQDPISSTDGSTHAMGCGSKRGAATVAVATLFIQDDTTPKVNEERAGCLRRDAGGEGACVMTPAMQVRRLTPVECERLQGFPDNHTMIPWRGKPAAECPDGPRYKALGNSWAVPVVRWIGERIARAT